MAQTDPRIQLNKTYDYPNYPFVLPPELLGETKQYQVVICGGGPVGLTLALELARYGVPSTVIETKNTVTDGSRAICMSERSMEILQPLGVADAFEAKGLPWTHGTSFCKNAPVYRLEMAHRDDARYYPMTNLQQYYIEQFLVDQASPNPLIEIRWGSKVVAAQNLENQVNLGIETPKGNYEMTADYVAACDGARSALRGALNLKLHGTSYEGRYLIADIELESELPTERLAFFNPDWNPDGTVLMHRQPDNLWRIDYQLQEDDDAELEMQEDRILERIQFQLDMIGETGAWRLEWYSLYKAHCLCLENYVEGRVIFCGDAAHLVPIFGVRGLNSGFADANNLGWKLAGICTGQIRPEILPSYDLERRAATYDVFDNAEKSTKFMTPPSDGFRLMRDAALSLSLRQKFTKGLLNPRQSQPYDYADSPLNANQGDEHLFDNGPRVGSPLLSVRLGVDNGDFLQNHIGSGFQVLLFQEDGAISERLFAELKELSTLNYFVDVLLICKAVPDNPAAEISYVTDPAGHCAAAYDALDDSCYLLRPDNHICARWKKLPAGVLHNAIRHSGHLHA